MTIFRKPVVLIDTVQPEGNDVIWLYNKMQARGLANQLHFISPTAISGNNYLKNISLITDINQLKTLCALPRNKRACAPTGLNEKLYAVVKEILSEKDLEFLTKLYQGNDADIMVHNKQDASRVYYIRKKLSLESSLEFKQLLQMILTMWSEHSSESQININAMKKMTIWENTKMQPPVWG